MTTARHMLNKLGHIFPGGNMYEVIYAIIHLGHLTRERDAAGFSCQFRTIDVKHLILPGDRLTREGYLRRTKIRVIRRLYNVPTSLVDIEDHAERLQNAKVVAFYDKQGTVCNSALGTAPQENLS